MNRDELETAVKDAEAEAGEAAASSRRRKAS
jgi:hypothetical protein